MTHYTNNTENNIHTDQIIEDLIINTWRMEQGCSMPVHRSIQWGQGGYDPQNI